MKDNTAIAKLNDFIKDIRIAMLTTVDQDGHLRSRPMGTHEMDEQGRLWFFTSKNSPKVWEIAQEHQVNVSYANPQSQTYVSVSGHATVNRERTKMEEFWSPILKAWFPDGLDDPDMILLEVNVSQAEYWDAPSGTVVNLIGFAKAIATGQRYEPGENEKLDLDESA